MNKTYLLMAMMWIWWIIKKTQLLIILRSPHAFFFSCTESNASNSTRLHSIQGSDLNNLHQYKPTCSEALAGINCIQTNKVSKQWTHQRNRGGHAELNEVAAYLRLTVCRSRCHSGLAETQMRNPAPQSLIASEDVKTPETSSVRLGEGGHAAEWWCWWPS